MWWNAIGLVSMITVPCVLAAVALAGALRQTSGRGKRSSGRGDP